MISSAAKDFIEKNIDLLDTNLRQFLGKALTKLKGAPFEDIVFTLKNAGIDIHEHRDQMLINRLGFIFPIVEDRTPLFDVIHDHVLLRGAGTFFGMTPFELLEFIYAHEDSWKDDMWLEEDIPGITIVRTHE